MALTFAAYAVPGPSWARAARRGRSRAGAHGRQPPRHHPTAGLAARPRRGSCSGAGVVVVGHLLGASAKATSGNLALERPGGLYGILQSAGSALLRLRRLCADRDARRGGPRPRAHDPTSDPAGSRHHGRRSTRSSQRCALALGPDALAASATPLVAAVKEVGEPGPCRIGVGAAIASLGALLALIAGIGRTAVCDGRRTAISRWLGSVHPRYRVPDHAELAVGGWRSCSFPDHRPARGDRLRRSAS